MKYLNLSIETLTSEAFLGSKPVDRATWLCLMRYCAQHETGGVIRDCGEWPTRKWMQVCGVFRKEVNATSTLWQWKDGSVHVAMYPLEQEAAAGGKRVAGKLGGSSASEGKKVAARANGVAGGRPKTQAETQAEGAGNPSETQAETQAEALAEASGTQAETQAEALAEASGTQAETQAETQRNGMERKGKGREEGNPPSPLSVSDDGLRTDGDGLRIGPEDSAAVALERLRGIRPEYQGLGPEAFLAVWQTETDRELRAKAFGEALVDLAGRVDTDPAPLRLVKGYLRNARRLNGTPTPAAVRVYGDDEAL